MKSFKKYFIRKGEINILPYLNLLCPALFSEKIKKGCNQTSPKTSVDLSQKFIYNT
jgi:hypothetical protein